LLPKTLFNIKWHSFYCLDWAAVYSAAGQTDFFSEITAKENGKLYVKLLDIATNGKYTHTLNENILLKKIAAASDERAAALRAERAALRTEKAALEEELTSLKKAKQRPGKKTGLKPVQ
jgi:hypothetical protein